MKKDKCKNWKKYKGIRKPTCGCTFCETFYTIKQEVKGFEDKELDEKTYKEVLGKVEAKLLELLLV